MKENKVRKLILAVLFLAIAVSVIVHFSVQGADTKSKISKQVSIGREMVLGAETVSYTHLDVYKRQNRNMDIPSQQLWGRKI